MLKDKCALVTGSTQGLGSTMAEQLAARGCYVMLSGFGASAEIERQRRHLEDSHGVRALHHEADLGVPSQITDLVETAERTFGAVDIVINNAVVRHFSPLDDFKTEEWDRTLAVNLSAAFHTARLSLSDMRRRDFLPRLVANAHHRTATGGIHGREGFGARRGDPFLHGLAPAVGSIRGDGGRGSPPSCAAWRPRHQRRGHSDQRRLQRQLIRNGTFLVAIPEMPA
ncbi:MAG: SDR family NAD(P)-dependent oxidoreductase [Reyranella sp.]|nr:SDR family NAD(P)-dependent oxidoreductase [Reyranella sp.]